MKVGDIVKVKTGFEMDLDDKGLLGIVVEEHGADNWAGKVPWVKVAWPHRQGAYRVRFLEVISESR